MELQKLLRHWVIHNGLNRIKFQGKCSFKSIFLKKCLLEVHQNKGKDVRARRTYIAYQHDAHIYNSAPRSCKFLLKWYRRISLHKHVTSRTGVIVLRFSGAQRRTRGGREKQVTQFALQTSHFKLHTSHFAIALCLPPFD